jgi:hypothetical protein
MTNWVLFTGELRLVNENFNSILNHNQAKANTKYIFVLWEKTSREKINWLKKSLPNTQIYLIGEFNINKEIKDDLKIPDTVENWMRQFYAIYKAHDLINSSLQTNDIVIRSRTDLLVSNLQFGLEAVDIKIPGIKFGIGFTDYFAIMNKKAFKNYAQTFKMMESNYYEGRFLPPEINLGLVLFESGVKIKTEKSLPRILLTLKNNKLIYRGSYSNENSQFYQHSQFSYDIISPKPNIFLRVFFRLYYQIKDLLVKIIFSRFL